MVQYQRIFIMIGEKMMFVNQNADAYDRETEEYIVAYLDLLGVTNRIKDYSQDELWSYVKKKYKLNTTNFLFLCNC